MLQIRKTKIQGSISGHKRLQFHERVIGGMKQKDNNDLNERHHTHQAIQVFSITSDVV